MSISSNPHSLPEFQRQLHSALESSASALDDFVGVRLQSNREKANREKGEETVKSEEEQWWFLDAGDLQSTAQISHRNVLGGLQPWVAGITLVRGETYTLIDMARILGVPSPANAQSWATLLSPRFDTSFALLWPHLIGMVPRHDLTLMEQKSNHPWVRRQWKDKEGRVWNELSVEQLILSKQFEQVWDPEQHPTSSV